MVRTWWPWYALGAVALATAGIWYAVLAFAPDEHLTVAFLDVGQGDAVFVETPEGNQLLIDAGADRGVVREVSAHMPFFDRSLDAILSTHPDRDHIGGFPAVLQHYDVGLALVPALTSDTDTYARFTELLRRQNIDVRRPRRGTALALGPDTTLTFLFPDRELTDIEPNAGSVVAKLTHGDTAFLLTGDSPDAIERYLARLEKKRLAADVLKVGHHGSETSTTLQLLGWSSPDYAIISAGKDNRYGHPDTEVLTQLARFGIETLGTYEEGTIVFESDGREVQYVSN